MPSLRVIGPGRAGGSLALALWRAGWDVLDAIGRGDDVSHAADDVDLVVIATPDRSIAEVAVRVRPIETTVVAHMAGSLGLDVLAPHYRRASVHPLVAMSTPDLGAQRLAAGAWFAVAGDPIVRRLVDDLGGHWFEVCDDDRTLYHAAAVIASNHLVALMGQVQRVAESIGVPFEAYFDLIRSTVDNVVELGPHDALTGPAARGDTSTIERHLEALNHLEPSEREAYEAMVHQIHRLIGEP